MRSTTRCGVDLHALQQGDRDDSVRVQIIRRAGGCFPPVTTLAAAMPAWATVLYGRRRRPVAATYHRGLDGNLGPGQAGDRPGARFLPGGRQ